jgi:hypothetical protein
VSKVAKNLERFRVAVAAHDRENPTHDRAYGIGVSHFDLERLGFEEGERLWEGVTIQVDAKATGNFRVICGLNHGEEPAAEVEQTVTRAVGVDA